LQGTSRLKIYGQLIVQLWQKNEKGQSGFLSLQKGEAQRSRFRPCAHCYENGISTMDLFKTEPLTNQLPYEGEVLYYGKILTSDHNRSIISTRMLQAISPGKTMRPSSLGAILLQSERPPGMVIKIIRLHLFKYNQTGVTLDAANFWS
jgi:hypothetical protein